MPAGVYLHIPFCSSRCSYCDFATDVYRESGSVERYVDALCKEIASFESRGIEADTIYFGGGTPSLLAVDQVGRILEIVRDRFVISDGSEITMEMNPATVTPGTLTAYHKLGVNRASFGVQTFNDKHLKLLARGHDAKDARETFRMLREAGFHNVSFDLIAGLPGQSLDDWRRNLEEAVALSPEHLSLYLLEIHEGTPLAEQVRSGRRPMPDEDTAAEMYQVMLDTLDGAGYPQYEISNFSRPDFQSRHNSKYWRIEPVYGFGVSAHSFNGVQRYANERDTARYVELIHGEGSAEVMREEIDASSEFVFLGLRLEGGIDLAEFAARFGKDLIASHGDAIVDLKANGLIELDGRSIRLTRRGKLFSNEVFAAFV
ncbi:MAG: radical SAM family heme chaperone HemW [Acidobacteria bacterium]|nr:radical SAM family heme chaperone HemW [Acidobacteriota bacterium]